MKTCLVWALLWPVTAFSQVAGDYRSAVVTGNWATVGSWQTFDGVSWIAASAVPTSANGTITILSGHTITAAATISVDQVVIDLGGTLAWTGGTCTFVNGTGVDLIINGTFWDNRATGAASIAFSGGATWQMGAAGTLLRTVSNSSNNWQSAYEGGIANIPATSNWILRKIGGQTPVLSSTTPTSGSVYPNLIIENTTTNAFGISFSGSTAPQIVKGNFDIGGTGAGTGIITFTNSNTNATPTRVLGKMTVRSPHIYQNYGTGTQLDDDITVNGTFSYDANDGRQLIFSGGNPQLVAGTGTLSIYNMTVNKSANDVTLNRAITVNNVLTLTSRRIFTTATNLLTINSSGSVTGASNNSFVSGPIRYLGPSAFTFPVGKGSDYQPIAISASSTGSTTFWTETFDGTVCPAGSGCDASLVGWTETLPSANGGNANKFFVSCTENGNAAGACGSGCGSDQTLHLGCIPNLFCGSGDCGAAYNATGASNVSDRRAESPVINCSAYSNIVISFNYIENGQGIKDNATLWYFDGTTWSQIDDMSKTATGCGGQGIWTAYSITLPASANGNPNVRIAFRWVNDGDGAGTDPSFAVDDITLTEVANSDFTAEYFYADPQLIYGSTLASPLTTLSTCEYWILNRNAGAENKLVTLTWDANSCPVTSLGTLRVARYDGISTWQNEGNTGTTGSTAAGTITSAMVASFSPFTLADITVLPIELLDFTANYDGTNVNCNWVTASELNNDFFTVERSPDGQHFAEIGVINGAGTTNIQQTYFLPDERPIKGMSYYRLRQTDYDGAYTYSPLRPVNIGGGSDLHLDFIAQQQAQVLFTYTLPANAKATLAVHDMTGRLVYTTPICGNTIALDRSLWAKGIYTVFITDGKTSDQRKFIVE